MLRPHLKRAGWPVLLCAVLVLSVIGWRQHNAIRQQQARIAEFEALQKKHAALEAQLVALRNEAAARREERVARSTSNAATEAASKIADEPFSGPLGNLKFLTMAEARGFGGLRSSFSGGMRAAMTIQFVKAFALTPADVALLKDKMAEATRQIERLSMANTTAGRNESGDFVITVKASPEGARVHDELLAAFRSTLGEERYPYFVQLAMEEFGGMLSYFGAQERTITIKPNPTGPDRYRFEDRSKAMTPGDGAWGRGGLIADRRQLVEMFPAFASLIPDDL